MLDFKEEVRPIEQHGFMLVDFMPDKMVLRMFKWDIKTQPVERSIAWSRSTSPSWHGQGERWRVSDGG